MTNQPQEDTEQFFDSLFNSTELEAVDDTGSEVGSAIASLVWLLTTVAAVCSPPVVIAVWRALL